MGVIPAGPFAPRWYREPERPAPERPPMEFDIVTVSRVRSLLSRLEKMCEGMDLTEDGWSGPVVPGDPKTLSGEVAALRAVVDAAPGTEVGISLRDAIADHLIRGGLAESKRGYGHATGQDVADAIVAMPEMRGLQRLVHAIAQSPASWISECPDVYAAYQALPTHIDAWGDDFPSTDT